MNYEKVIVELLSRIQVLEEQVAELMNQKDNSETSKEDTMTTKQIREYIQDLKKIAKENGKTTIVLRSGDIHKDLNLKSRLPMVCNAMKQCMNPYDVVLHTTPSGNSSTIEIEYKLV